MASSTDAGEPRLRALGASSVACGDSSPVTGEAICAACGPRGNLISHAVRASFP